VNQPKTVRSAAPALNLTLEVFDVSRPRGDHDAPFRPWRSQRFKLVANLKRHPRSA
jgi:hypothetical protein